MGGRLWLLLLRRRLRERLDVELHLRGLLGRDKRTLSVGRVLVLLNWPSHRLLLLLLLLRDVVAKLCLRLRGVLLTRISAREQHLLLLLLVLLL